nr:3-methyl-2-oxobutanoate hydroxymethyltransferase [Pseudorhizobium flavum]
MEADAAAVADAGAFAVLLEGTVYSLAEKITASLSVPTIGIGAPSKCDRQVLVLEDMLGLTERVPRFVRRSANSGRQPMMRSVLTRPLSVIAVFPAKKKSTARRADVLALGSVHGACRFGRPDFGSSTVARSFCRAFR